MNHLVPVVCVHISHGQGVYYSGVWIRGVSTCISKIWIRGVSVVQGSGSEGSPLFRGLD